MKKLIYTLLLVLTVLKLAGLIVISWLWITLPLVIMVFFKILFIGLAIKVAQDEAKLQSYIHQARTGHYPDKEDK